MSAGGVFKILTNDGKADQMLMATQLLKDRICDIIDARTAAGLKDTLPTLKDLEKTHVLHFQSKFKPFVALGYEYQKVKPQSGTTQLGGSVTFSIPQFGDFLSDMVLNVTLSSCSYAPKAIGVDPTVLPSSVPTIPMVNQSTTTNPSVANNAYVAPVTSYTTTYVTNSKVTLPDGRVVDVVANEDIGGAQRLVIRRFSPVDVLDADGKSILSSSTTRSDRAFYCDYPGERLMQKVSFDVNGNPLDDYDYMSYAFHRKFRLSQDKLVAYNRNMGQQIATQAQSGLSLGGLTKQVSVTAGPQTPQAEQPELSMWIKLLFWFNLDQSQALVSAAIPYGQRFINIDLAKVDDLVGRAPAAWKRIVMTTDVYSSTGTITDNKLTMVTNTHDINKGQQTTNEVLYYPIYTNGDMTAPSLKALDLYVNNIFTIPEVHDIYIERIGFSLIRVHRIQREGVNTTQKDILLSQFKYPVEFFYCGLRPNDNVTLTGSGPTGASKYSDWHRFTSVSRKSVQSTAKVAHYDAATSSAKIGLVTESITVPTETRTIDTVSVTAHGVALYNTLDSRFFNQYLPEVYGGSHLVSPHDQGVLFVNFCLHPYQLQPSGHINTSRAREFFIQLKTTGGNDAIIDSTFMAEASALNFLLVSDGTAVLRYTT